jgi:hypothetical protein
VFVFLNLFKMANLNWGYYSIVTVLLFSSLQSSHDVNLPTHDTATSVPTKPRLSKRVKETLSGCTCSIRRGNCHVDRNFVGVIRIRAVWTFEEDLQPLTTEYCNARTMQLRERIQSRE